MSDKTNQSENEEALVHVVQLDLQAYEDKIDSLSKEVEDLKFNNIEALIKRDYVIVKTNGKSAAELQRMLYDLGFGACTVETEKIEMEPISAN